MDLIETLKIYGEADLTVSVSKLTVAPATLGRALVGTVGTLYVKDRVPTESVVKTDSTGN